MTSDDKKLNTSKWKTFVISDIFDEVEIAKSLDLLDTETSSSGINYVGRTRENNGITAKLALSPDLLDLVNVGNCLTVAMVGDSTCSTFFQETDFLASQNILILRSKHLDKYNTLFLANIIQLEKYRFSYGRTLTKGYFQKHSLRLPARGVRPDWELMSNYIKSMEVQLKKPSSQPVLSVQKNLRDTEWQEFGLPDIFQITGSVTTPVLELEECGVGGYPYITTQASNNGVEGFFNFFTEEGGILTVDSAVVGYCAYQPKNFSASDHVEKLIPRFLMNKYVAMFIVALMNKEQYRYNYGRKCSHERMKRQRIKLPTKGEKPDWEFMETYIKALPYSSSL